MEKKESRNKLFYMRWVLLRLALVVFDIVAVNFSYALALVTRFYVASEFNIWGVRYIEPFLRFAPWYTLSCLVIFALFKLYNSRWKYAGLNDMNRIVLACLLTTLVQVIGSALFVMRMPITYYVIGGLFQFGLIAGSRFSYRIFLMERERVRKMRSGTSINVMIAGASETSHLVRKHLERDPENAAHPVCILDFRGEEFGTMLEGLPVVGGMDKLESAIAKYNVECVILADMTMPDSVRKEIRKICAGLNVEVQDFSGYFQDARGALTLRNLMGYTSGPVELVMDGKHQRFANGEQVLMNLTGRYVVKAVFAREGRLVVELQKDIQVLNNIEEDWVRSYEQETGEDISFF